MKTESRRAGGQIGRSHSGAAWHGPSVLETLEGITPAQAAAKPIEGAHSIWELVKHVSAWQALALQTFQGADCVSLEDDANFPPVEDTSADAWAHDIQAMSEINAQLVAAVKVFPEEMIETIVPGKPFSYYGLMHGIAEHNIYHAGQISLLRRLAVTR